MRLGALVLVLAVVGCSRRETPSPAPAPAPSTTATSSHVSLLPSLCAKLLAAQAVKSCTLNDSGQTATFDKGKAHGTIVDTGSREDYAFTMHNVATGKYILAALPDQFIIAYWTTTGSDDADGTIRETVETP